MNFKTWWGLNHVYLSNTNIYLWQDILLPCTKPSLVHNPLVNRLPSGGALLYIVDVGSLVRWIINLKYSSKNTNIGLRVKGLELISSVQYNFFFSHSDLVCSVQAIALEQANYTISKTCLHKESICFFCFFITLSSRDQRVPKTSQSAWLGLHLIGLSFPPNMQQEDTKASVNFKGGTPSQI